MITKRMLAASLLLGTTAVATGQALAQQNPQLRPSGDWTIAQDGESCTLSRPYAAQEAGDTTLFLRSFGPQAALQASIAGPTMMRGDRRSELVSISFDDATRVDNMAAIASALENLPMVQFQLGIEGRPLAGDAFLARGVVDATTQIVAFLPRAAAQMHLRGPHMAGQTLALADMEQSLALLSACEERLVAAWGYDPAIRTRLARGPELTNASSIREQVRYPANLLINRVSRIVHFRVKVDAEGKASDCVVQSNRTDQQTFRDACRLLVNTGQFAPARDALGLPVPWFWRGSLMLLRFD